MVTLSACTSRQVNRSIPLWKVSGTIIESSVK